MPTFSPAWVTALGKSPARVLSLTLTDPPGSPTEGDLYIPAATATAEWAGHEDEFALFTNGAWQFRTDAAGYRIYDVETDTHYVNDST